MAAHAGRDQWRERARALTAPRQRLLPAAGARLGRRPRLAAAVLASSRRLPGRRLRVAARTQLAIPLVHGMRASLDVPLEGGGRMLVDTTDVTGRVLATSGLWEPNVTAVFRQLLRSGDVVVDVGANIGYFTVVAARLVGPGGHVHAVEPNPGISEVLAANVRHNALGNVTTHGLAAGAAEGEAVLHDARGVNAGASSIRSDPGPRLGAVDSVGVTVPVRPLADLLTAEEAIRLRLVKIDVEGYEAEVLAGLEPVLDAGHRPVLVVEMHVDLDPDVRAFVAAFCDRHRLRIERIVDRGDVDRKWAAGHPLLEEIDDLEHVDDLRFDILLTAAPR